MTNSWTCQLITWYYKWKHISVFKNIKEIVANVCLFKNLIYYMHWRYQFECGLQNIYTDFIMILSLAFTGAISWYFNNREWSSLTMYSFCEISKLLSSRSQEISAPVDFGICVFRRLRHLFRRHRQFKKMFIYRDTVIFYINI